RGGASEARHRGRARATRAVHAGGTGNGVATAEQVVLQSTARKERATGPQPRAGTAATDRGPADSGGANRVGIPSRQLHPRRLDLGHAPSLRVLQPQGAQGVQPRDPAAGQALCRAAGPARKRVAGTSPESAFTLVSETDHL